MGGRRAGGGLRISPTRVERRVGKGGAMLQGLSGLRVVSFESRRSAEMAELIRNYGGEPIQAPSLREVPLADQHEALAFGEALLAGDHDVLILLTGVGTRMLIATLSTRWPREDVVARLGRLTLVCRGPKPIAALKEVGLVPTLAVPEPNTWRDVLSELDRTLAIGGKRAPHTPGRPRAFPRSPAYGPAPTARRATCSARAPRASG